MTALRRSITQRSRGCLQYTNILTITGLSTKPRLNPTKESLQTKQIAGLILGLVVMVLTSLIDYSWVLGFYWLSYFVGIGLLAAVLLAGENVGGATRWIRVGGVLQFQPSDVVKILMIAFFAKFF